MEDGDVRVSVMDESGSSMLLNSNLSICGGKAWKTVLEGNPLSFESIHSNNKDARVGAIEEKRKHLFHQTSSSFGI